MEGDCHYLEGNLNARRRVEYIQGLLDQIGIEKQRLRMINISSAMGSEFARSGEDFTHQITELGPNPLRLSINKESKEKIK